MPIKLCLFIDGLDEYEGDDSDVAELFGNTLISQNIKICVSSRPHQVFVDTFATRPRLRLQDLTSLDIRQYVFDKLEQNEKMRRLRSEQPVATRELISEIDSAANGVFIWVTIVVGSLLSGLGKHDEIEDLQERLRILPKELDDLYDHMVFKVDQVHRKGASQVFQLVGCAAQHRHDDWQETEALSILLLSFATERDSGLALRAPMRFLNAMQVLNRCKRMEIVLRTRCGGLLEVHYGRLDSQNTDIAPEMKVRYLHRTVKDFLELWKTRRKLHDQTGGDGRDAFNPNVAMLKAHILMIKSLDNLQRSPQTLGELIDGTLTYARRAEFDTQIGQPALLDEFYKIISQTWSNRSPNDKRSDDLLYTEHKSMLTLAAHCDLQHYLQMKLTENNIIGQEKSDRTLIEYALLIRRRSQLYISVGVIRTLLKFGADPNTHSGDWTLWQIALSRLQVEASLLDEERRSVLLTKWVDIIKALLDAGADPNTLCPHSTSLPDKRMVSLNTIKEVISTVYESHPQLKFELLQILAEKREKRIEQGKDQRTEPRMDQRIEPGMDQGRKQKSKHHKHRSCQPQ